MKRFMGGKFRGDTLVEVSLAIGIFSMVAIAAVAVINSSTTGAQTALENTIIREEMDGQAEALRFIQSAYVAGGEIDTSDPTKYASLWQALSDRAIDLSGLSASERDQVLKYNPVSCEPIYNSSGSAGWNTLKKQNAFVINTRAMNSNNLSDIIVDFSPSVFRTASTYPRLVYNNADIDALYDPSETNNVFKITSAEGLYIVAVRDEEGTVVVNETGDYTTIKSAYIDFYIRSCWFTPSANRASTISTAIRLYDPDAIAANKYQKKGVLIRYGGNGASTGDMAQQYVFAGETAVILENRFVWPGHKFRNWNTATNGTGTTYKPGDVYRAPSGITTSTALTLYAQWDVLQVKIQFRSGKCSSPSGSMTQQTITAGTTAKLKANAFTCNGHTFDSWNTREDGKGTKYTNQQNYTAPADALEENVTLYAQWKPLPYSITYDVNGGSYQPTTQYCYLSTIAKCYLNYDREPSRSGYKFLGWADTPSATSANPNYTNGKEINITGNRILYAVWQTRNEKITVTLTWGSSPKDLDAYVTGEKSDGTRFTAYYSNKVGSDVSGLTIAQLDRDVTSGYGPETFTINTLGGRNYYYSVRNYSSDSSITNATVVVEGDYIGKHTFSAANATGSGRVWNVFAYKDGLLVYKGTRSNTALDNY